MDKSGQLNAKGLLFQKALKSCALVLGGYVNGYNIIRALYEAGVREIVLFDTRKRLGKFSNICKWGYRNPVD